MLGRALRLIALLIAGLSAPALAAAAPVETPAHFLGRVFALYPPHSRFWDESRAGDAYRAQVTAQLYEPAFAKLIDDNRTLAGRSGDEDLDYDPVCQCQAEGGGYAVVSGKLGAAGRFEAKVRRPGHAPWTIVLAPAGPSWRIYDVIDQSGDLRVWLARHNDCMRRFKTDADLTRCEKD